MANVGYATLSVIPSAKGFGAALTKSVAPEMAAAGKTSGMTFAKGMAAGIAGVALVGVGVVTGLAAIGKTFHDMSATIRVETGKSGAALDGLVASAKNVGRTTPASFEVVGKTIAGLNVRLGLTGPTLELLSRQFIAAGRITKQSLDLSTVTGSFNAFNIKGKDTSKALDSLFRISQATGVGINELAAATTKGAPAFRQFGMSFSDSAALVGVLDKAGINSGKTISALTIGLTKFAKAGKEPQKALRDTIDQIQAFTKSGNDAAAIKLAASIFGTKGAAQFVAAVKSGKVNLDDMMKSAGAGKDTIMTAASAVSTFSGKWGVFKNNVLIALEPIATRVFKALGDGMQFMNDVGLPAVVAFGAALSAKVAPVLKTISDFITGTVIPGLKVFFAFLTGNSAGIGAGKFTDVANAALSIRDAIGKVSDFITGTMIPAIKNFITEFQNGEGAGGKFRDVLTWIYENVLTPLAVFITATLIPALLSISGWILDTGIPAFTSFLGWLNDNSTTIGVIAGIITAVLLPALIGMAVQATVSGLETAAIWLMLQADAIASVASQVGQMVIAGAKWVWLGLTSAGAAAASVAAWVAHTIAVVAEWVATSAKAVFHAAAVAASWVASVLGVVAAWVIAKTGMIAEWVASAASAVVHAAAVAASWVASVAGVVAAWAVTTVAVIADWVAIKVAAAENAIQIAASWVVAMGPVAWVLALLAAVAAGMYLIGTRTQWYQTIWHDVWYTVSTYLAMAWNTIIGPTIRLIILGFADIATGVGDFLTALSHIPGFGWAKNAGDLMHTAADKARNLADEIRMIPVNKLVTVGVKANFSMGDGGANAFGFFPGGAAGGMFRGPGSGTSDSMLARVSNGEFVTNAAATARNLPLLKAINSGAPGFAAGGVVGLLPPSVNTRMDQASRAFTSTWKLNPAAIASLSSAGTGGGAAQWSGVVLAVLAMLGQSPGNLGAVLRLINKESGGNPTAINLTDSNASAGTPSQGLLQTIPGTFAAYAGPFAMMGITNPFANIYAGLRYALSRYGSIAAVDPLVHAGGYAFGTSSAAPGYAWVGERGPELVRFKGGEQVTPNSALGGGPDGGNGDVVAAVNALGDRFGSELQAQARTIQMMQRQMAGAR